MGGFLSHLEPEINSEVLNATCGPIRGNVYRHKDKTVDGYLGIPFAEPPERFEKPIGANVWTEVKECTKYGPGCPQSGVFEQMMDQLGLTFDEKSCLTLNVFAPRRKSDEMQNGFPVMMNIFGGGFEMGTSAAYDDYSISGVIPLKDVILVTLNYRVGVLGFFTTGNDISPGNLALWDQTLALKWIQKHIRSFGGDPNNVTVSGCSAGGVCADLLTLSPYSRDLFQKSISMSGSADCEMACRSNKNQATIFKDFAQDNGCLETDELNLLRWYQAQSIEMLYKLSAFKFSPSGFMSCAPNLDGDFFPKPLEELRGDAPKKSFIFGRTEFEGLIMAIPDPIYSRIGDNIDVSSSKLFRSDVVENPDDIHKYLKTCYMEGIEKSDAPSIRKRFIEFLGDAVFNVGILNSAQKATASGNDVYLYSFDYCNPDGYGPLGALLDFNASSHGNDFRYIFGSGGYEKFTPTEEEFHVMEKMSTLFTNFAKYGDPNGKTENKNWVKYCLEFPGNYFKIDYPTSEMNDDILKEGLQKMQMIKRKKIEL